MFSATDTSADARFREETAAIDCSAPDRICNVLAIYYKKMRNIEMEVILINEDLGY